VEEVTRVKLKELLGLSLRVVFLVTIGAMARLAVVHVLKVP